MKILILIFFFEIKESKITRGHNFTLVKKQSRLDIRKFSFSQRTINVWNKLSAECVHASSLSLRSLACLPGAARWSVNREYTIRSCIESCLWRGFVPAGEPYAFCSLFAEAIWRLYFVKRESDAQTLQTTLYYTALDASLRPVLPPLPLREGELD